MALTSTLGSPGIEIREVDNSIRLDSSTATTIYVPGFAAQGPVDEVMSIGSIGDFELIYGVPTNAAERYFYYTVKAILDNSGNGATVLCSRMPYGEKAGDTVSNAYTMLVYPAVPVIKKNHGSKDNPIFYDFDQFVIKENKKTSIEELFSSFITRRVVKCEIKDFYMSLDDDWFDESETVINITSFNADGDGGQIPSSGSLISNEKDGLKVVDFIAPSIGLETATKSF